MGKSPFSVVHKSKWSNRSLVSCSKFSYLLDTTSIDSVYSSPPFSSSAWAGALWFWWKVLVCCFYISTSWHASPSQDAQWCDSTPWHSLWAGSLCADPFLFFFFFSAVPCGLLSRCWFSTCLLSVVYQNWKFPNPSSLSVVPTPPTPLPSALFSF